METLQVYIFSFFHCVESELTILIGGYIILGKLILVKEGETCIPKFLLKSLS